MADEIYGVARDNITAEELGRARLWSPIELNAPLEPTGAPLVRRRSVRENEGE